MRRGRFDFGFSANLTKTKGRRKPKSSGRKIGTFKPKEGELFFPEFGKEKTRVFSGKKYYQGAFSSSKKEIDSYKKEVLKRSGVKYRMTKSGKNYQTWIRKKK